MIKAPDENEKVSFTVFFNVIKIFFFCFVWSGGEDKQLKVWDYTLGDVTHVGMPLGASITSTKICSNNNILVCATADGGVWQWRFPHPPSS